MEKAHIPEWKIVVRRITLPGFRVEVTYYLHEESGASVYGCSKRELEFASGWTPEEQRQLAGSVHDSRVPSGTTPGKETIISTSVAE